MEALGATASIIAILNLSSKVLGYLTDVKTASKDRDKCAVETSNLYSLLFRLKSLLEEGSSNEPWYNTVRALGVENGPLDQYKQALEQLQAKVARGGKRKAVGDSLTWNFIKDEVASILARMGRLNTLVQVALEMDHLKLSQAIKKCADITHSKVEAVKDDTSFIRTHIPGVQSGLDVIQQDHDHARHKKLMGWISPTEFPAQQSDFIARRQEGTGEWFLNDPKFTQWLQTPKGTLFCPGIPGAGKTIITAIAIDHLWNAVRSSTIGVAYVYCNYNAHADQNAADLLAAILKQLVQTQPSIATPVENLHQQHADRGTRPLFEEIFSALQSVLANYSSVYIAVDALDELPDRHGTRRQFLAKLQELQGKLDLRLLATSRFIPDIMSELSTALRLEVRASDEDINRFVAGQKLPKCIQDDNTLQERVRDKVVKAVDGMFLLARLHVDLLLDKRTRSKVFSTLETLSRGPEAINKAYEKAIERIKDQSPDDVALATRVLSWIIHSRRPLTTEELCHALAVESDDKDLDRDNILDIDEIVSLCAGLVTVDEKSNTIRLVHYTTQEYFEKVQGEWNDDPQLKITITCLTYLSFSEFKSGSCPTDEDLERRLKRYPFLKYAARHWGLHILTVQKEMSELAGLFLQCGSLASSASQARMSANSEYIVYHPRNAIGLHLTAEFGLLCLSEEFLSSSDGNIITLIDWKDSRGRTPLWVAATHGHYTVAELLINKGADPNAEGEYRRSVLCTASANGHEQVVMLLLDKGAKVNPQPSVYENALQAAATEGYQQIVQLLLDNGAEVNAQGGLYGNALQAAAATGHQQTVQLLLDNGAEVNAQGGDWGNALQAAAATGHEQTVQLLLDNGAEVNAQ
ncbi:hypothetical protein MMC29_002397, partial [Sticta canariensis]|nr:hypothetical protein [Sticta canariensis]